MPRFPKLRRRESLVQPLPDKNQSAPSTPILKTSDASPPESDSAAQLSGGVKKSLISRLKERTVKTGKHFIEEVPARSSNQTASPLDPPQPVAHDTPPLNALTDVEQRAKASRRAARRAQRDKKQHEWEDENRQRKHQSIVTNLPFDPLPPLSDFDSASEDELHPSSLPSNPSPDATESSRGAPLLNVPNAQKHGNNRQDAELAELFAAQAFTTAPSHLGTSAPDAPPPEEQFQSLSPQATTPQHFPALATTNQPTPIGWGNSYDTVPSQPMYGTPAHLSSRGPTISDNTLTEKIRRGRELALLAIHQEEQGNMGAAEAGYMKALGLLVPASKELDIGSELNKSARISLKSKVQREAAAMLDRCEQLRLFLKATAPDVPTIMPKMPSASIANKSTRTRAPRNTSPPRKRRTSFDEEPMSPDSAVMQPRVERKESNSKVALRPLPPPPPAFNDDPRELFQRIEDRTNVLSAASVAFPSFPDIKDTHVPHPPVPETQVTKAKCFMCNETAHLQTPCEHTFCSTCGNQAVSVFGTCPVPGCTTPLRSETFTHIIL